jgi:hypothetical protein
MKMIKKIIAVDHHRNGVCGTGFNVVLFKDRETRENFVGILPDGDENKWNSFVLSVDRLAAGNIAFGSNSWRGDNYAEEIKEAVAKWESTR